MSMCTPFLTCLVFFFFNDTATTEIYTLSLHDALPISTSGCTPPPGSTPPTCRTCRRRTWSRSRSEEHTSELQSRVELVCRLLPDKKKHRPDPRHRPHPGHGRRPVPRRARTR